MATTSKPSMVLDENNDFGFTFHDETEVQQEVLDDTARIKTAALKYLTDINAMIVPLLNNLAQNPDKDIIKWPAASRVKAINSFKAKLNALVTEASKTLA